MLPSENAATTGTSAATLTLPTGFGKRTGDLDEMVKQRSVEVLGSPMQPFDGDFAVTVPSEWNTDGRLFVRQTYPLPCTILDLIPEVNPGR